MERPRDRPPALRKRQAGSFAVEVAPAARRRTGEIERHPALPLTDDPDRRRFRGPPPAADARALARSGALAVQVPASSVAGSLATASAVSPDASSRAAASPDVCSASG